MIRLRKLARAASLLTTPLAPEDILSLFNPVFSARQLRGVVTRVVPETADSATIFFRPGRGWQAHLAGQWARIGVELDGVRFGVVHETGPATGREARMDAGHDGVDVLVFGHSHIPWDTVTPRGIRLLNPGSPTDRRRQPVCTMMTAVADAGSLRDVALVPVAR